MQLNKKPPMGRPRKTEEPPFSDKALYQLLIAKLPEKYRKDGTLATRLVAKDCGVSRMTVYRWMNDLAMSARSAKKLIAISEGALTNIDMIPFMLRA